MPRSTKISEFTSRARDELAQLANDNAPPAAADAVRELMNVVLNPGSAPAGRPAGDRPLNEAEMRTVRSLIAYQGDQFGVFNRLIELAVEIAFDVDGLADLRAAQYDALVIYLVHLPSGTAAAPARELFEGRQP